GRYALSQLKRLGQSMRLAEHRRLLLEWLAETPDLSLDGAARRLATAALTAEDQPGRDDGDRSHRAKQYIKQLYGSMFDQGLLRERNYASLVEFAASRQHSFELPRELRPKNAYNLLRLLATARYWLRTGRPEFVVVEPLRSELLAIKRQQVELPAIIARAEELAAELEQARADTPLPAQADVARIDALLRRLRQEAARRWHRDQPGPFGRDAAEMPLAHWD
ncbi:MAG: nucleotidyltransferase domain-containing protein, partial [Myxococcota bacterium]